MPKMIFITPDGVTPDGARREVDAPVGQSLMEIARAHDLDIEGTCDGTLSCSTCHVIVPPEYFPLLDAASEDEEDMLDLCLEVTKFSRLGCQVRMTDALNGLTVTLPEETVNWKRG